MFVKPGQAADVFTLFEAKKRSSFVILRGLTMVCSGARKAESLSLLQCHIARPLIRSVRPSPSK